ncbi:carbohydrate ABC transporter permease [Nocardioides sp. MAHUQ-72]|uniref:carbohydrate ABC transporter permease n=1 Tax=unclassified Nocardioides TaxID=2615069 RepID=UPI003609F028
MSSGTDVTTGASRAGGAPAPGEPTPPDQPAPAGPREPGDPDRMNVAKVLTGLVGVIVVVWFIGNLFLALAYHPDWFASSKILIGVIALIAGVGGAWLFFFFINMFVEGLPGRLSRGLMPYAFLIPGIGLIALMLVYPTIQTINYAFANSDSTEYVGFDNFKDIFTGDTSDEFWLAISNNILWLIIVPAVTVVFGVVVAVLADKLSTRGEKVSKSTIFLPMAISFVGASAIWSLVYAYDPANEDPTGLLNAVWRALGGDPQTWLQVSTLRLNSILMMVILIWLQVGFAMILLSSAIKGVPEETIEAARIDGASEWKIFSQVVIPQIKGTIITVFITVVILVLKVFDIVYVLTNGRDKTNVIANLFFNELINNEQAGVASAIVVVLLLAVTPILIYQVRHFRREEMVR